MIFPPHPLTKLICFLLCLCLARADEPASTARGAKGDAVAHGSFPDIALDSQGNVHLVYSRTGLLYYKKYDATADQWGPEEFTGVLLESAGGFGVERSEPDIVIDSHNRPHVMGGSDYAYLDKNNQWVKVTPASELIRDTKLGIDSKNNVYLLRRGGHNGGFCGLLKLTPGASAWVPLTDPDRPLLSWGDHVFGDIAIGRDDTLHVVYRTGKPRPIAYRRSTDGGVTWTSAGISDGDAIGPDVETDSNNAPYVVDGEGLFFRPDSTSETPAFIAEGKVVSGGDWMRPDLAIDRSNQMYASCFGGKYNVRRDGTWIGERTIRGSTDQAIGFVEMAAADIVYAIWEEGNTVHKKNGAGIVKIGFGKISRDGEVTLLTGAGPERAPAPVATKNLALHKPTTYLSQLPGREASGAVDGFPISHWAALDLPSKPWLQVDLGRIHSIGRTEVLPRNKRPYTFDVSVSADDVTFITVVSRTSPNAGESVLTDTFAAIPARHVRLTVTGAAPDFKGKEAGIEEFRIFEAAVAASGNPAPVSPK